MRPLTPVSGEVADVKELRLMAVDQAMPGLPAGGLDLIRPLPTFVFRPVTKFRCSRLSPFLRT